MDSNLQASIQSGFAAEQYNLVLLFGLYTYRCLLFVACSYIRTELDIKQ